MLPADRGEGTGCRLNEKKKNITTAVLDFTHPQFVTRCTNAKLDCQADAIGDAVAQASSARHTVEVAFPAYDMLDAA